MRGTLVRPTGQERAFGEHELIVTKTDPKGVITYANDVFLRLSALTEAEALGAPHNLIRHPDMPRCVFQLLWETIGRGEEMFAYVLNLAVDGAHYWVLAHVTPSHDAAGRLIGYHSNRRKPTRPAVTAVSALYARLCAEERRHPRTPDAIEAGAALLRQELAAHGDYERFVWALADPQPGVTP